MNEEWDTPEAAETTCDHCGRVRKCEHLPDPYIAEVSPEEPNTSSWWCYPCFSRRKDDV